MKTEEEVKALRDQVVIIVDELKVIANRSQELITIIDDPREIGFHQQMLAEVSERTKTLNIVLNWILEIVDDTPMPAGHLDLHGWLGKAEEAVKGLVNRLPIISKGGIILG